MQHKESCTCIRCKAERYLTHGDWRIVRFFIEAQHYVEHVVTPDKVLRFVDLQAWVKVCHLREEPLKDHYDLISCARFLLDAVEGRAKKWKVGVHRFDAAELAPPGEPQHG